MEARLACVDRLLALERRVGALYRRWAADGSFPEELRSFWRDMAEDERRHIAILERSAGLLNFAVAAPVISTEQAKQISAAIATVEQANDSSETAIEELLSYAILLESSELKHLDTAWVEGFQPDPANLAQAWTPAHRRHIRRLAGAIRRFSVNANLHKEAAELLSQCEREESLPHDAKNLLPAAGRTTY